MSEPLRVRVVVRSSAPPERVWAVLADARRWSEWAAFSSSSLEREGTPAPDGVGALRRFGTGPVVSREEVVAFEPPHRLAYEMRSGMPLRDYHAEVTLTPWPSGGTEITWDSRFEPRFASSGRLLRGFLRRVLTDTAKRMARRAERDQA